MDAISDFKHTLARLYQIPYDVLFPGERTDETLEKTKIAPAIPGFGSGTGRPTEAEREEMPWDGT